MTTDNKIIVYAWLLILLACVLFVSLKGKIASGLDSFSLQDTEVGKTADNFLANKNLLSRLLIISINNDQQHNLSQSSKALKKRLLASSDFEFIHNGQVDNNDPSSDLFFKYRYLLSDRFDRQELDATGLKRALASLIPKTFSLLYQYNRNRLLADPTGESNYLVRSYFGNTRLKKIYGVWFDSKADKAVMLAYLEPEIAAGVQRQAMMERVTQAFKQSRVTSQQSLHLTGPATFTAISRNIIKSEVGLFSSVGSLLIVGLLYFSFRRKRIILLVVVPVLTAILLAASVTIIVFGSIHGITLAFGIILLGICIDYPIHLFSHTKPGETLQQTIQTVWPVIRLGVFTTLSAFVLMLFSNMPGLVQLGLFTLVGIVAAAITTRWVLPCLTGDPGGTPSYHFTGITEHIRSSKRLIYVLSAGIGVSLLILYNNLSGPIIATSLTSLNPVPTHELQFYEHLRKDIGLPQSYQYIAISADTSEAVLREQERIIAKLDSAGHMTDGFLYAARYLPSSHRQKIRKSALPDKPAIRKILYPLLKELPFRDEVFEPFINDVARSRLLLPLTYDDILNSFLGSMVSSLLFKTKDAWVGVIFVDSFPEAKLAGSVLQARYAKKIKYHNLKHSMELLFNNYRDSILEKTLFASLAIVLVLLLGLRSMSRLLRVVLPVLLTIMLTMLIVYHIQGPLTIFHLIALILVFGICVDYSLFFNSEQSTDNDGRTLYAITICVLSTLAVFGLLASSDIVVLQSIGLTVAIGSAVAYLISFFYSTRAT